VVTRRHGRYLVAKAVLNRGFDRSTKARDAGDETLLLAFYLR
jgi:tetraacyldisaccharide-1-P 4'-kinase